MIISKELYEQISNITIMDYEGVLIKDKDEYFVSEENMECMLKDLINEIQHKEEEFQDYKKDIEERYEIKKTNPYHDYGVSKEDFIDKNI